MIIENSKTYNLTDVENLFFRPSFCGKAAEDMGVRVLYNMPMPTKVPLFSHNHNILRGFEAGWQGGTSKLVQQKEIPLMKLKAESSYSAEDYFSTIYELITNSAEVNLGDMTGTDLEKAETELFRRSIAESVYATTWFGDVEGKFSSYTGFTGFIPTIHKFCVAQGEDFAVKLYSEDTETATIDLFRNTWMDASDELRALAAEGQLAYFVSSDIYDAYRFYIDENGMSRPYDTAIPTLYYHGIPVIEVPSKNYDLLSASSFCILTDRRNLILALNTADSPEKEIRMWYNPDEIENRQRVVFLAGTAIADENLLSGSIYDAELLIY